MFFMGETPYIGSDVQRQSKSTTIRRTQRWTDAALNIAEKIGVTFGTASKYSRELLEEINSTITLQLRRETELAVNEEYQKDMEVEGEVDLNVM